MKKLLKFIVKSSICLSVGTFLLVLLAMFFMRQVLIYCAISTSFVIGSLVVGMCPKVPDHKILVVILGGVILYLMYLVAIPVFVVVSYLSSTSLIGVIVIEFLFPGYIMKSRSRYRNPYHDTDYRCY